MKLNDVIEKQHQFAKEGHAKDITFRKTQLIKLKKLLQANFDKLSLAINTDIRKSRFETYLTELGLVYSEIDHAVAKVSSWSKSKKVSAGLSNFPGQAFIRPEPFGVTLIIGAWNYPYQLTLAPMVAAIAAGNTCVVKPSELPVHTSAVLAEIINNNFDPSYLYVVEGGIEVNQELLSYKFDKIFFTGSTTVGKIVAKAAAEHLTPVTLELGGKSPCIVFADANLKIAAQRILWGKFLNAGQTCIAPDYLLVEQSVYLPLLEELKRQLPFIVGVNPRESESYLRIINQKNVARLKKLIPSNNIVVGGEVIESENYIAPTIIKDASFSDDIMKEEIFGPLLPVLPFTDFCFFISKQDEIKGVGLGKGRLVFN